MEVKIEIETNDKRLDFDLLETKDSISRGMEKQIAKGVLVRYEGTGFRKATGFPDIIHITIAIAEGMSIGIASGLISAWLYDKLKGKSVEKIRIERIEVTLNKGEIERILMEKIKKSE